MIKTAALVGDYGDLFWSLGSSVSHVAGGEIFTRIYVANVTDENREYMLMAVVSSGGTKITEFPIKVNGSTWFIVGANDTVRIPSSIEVAYTSATLTLNLYERESNEITDSVSTALIGLLPAFPETPVIADTMGSLITMMVIIMMMTMMSKAMAGEEEK